MVTDSAGPRGGVARDDGRWLSVDHLATGPNGLTPTAANEPAAFQTPSALNTAEDVIAVGLGNGAEKLRGFTDNTAIFEILHDAL
jgi:alkaline phosphatase